MINYWKSVSDYSDQDIEEDEDAQVHPNKDIWDFIDYFEENWCSKNSGWFEGFANGIPSTNNGLERKNLEIKELYTLRKRLPFTEFKTVAETIVQDWSYELRDMVIF